MKLLTSRTFDDLKPVLQDPSSAGPDTVYEVHTDLNDPQWVNKTTIQPGKQGSEYTKTFGHYHTTNSETELYRVESGEGILVLQKKHEVLLVRAKTGDQILINPEYGHSWSNIGSEPLVLLDNWSFGHSDEDYAFIAKHHGMAYYIVEENGQPKAVANTNYVESPKPTWATPDQLPQGV